MVKLLLFTLSRFEEHALANLHFDKWPYIVTSSCSEGTLSSIETLSKDNASCWQSYIAALFWTADHYCTCKAWILSFKIFLSHSVCCFLESLYTFPPKSQMGLQAQKCFSIPACALRRDLSQALAITSTIPVMSAYTSLNPFTRQHRLDCGKDWKQKEKKTIAYFGRVTFKVPTGRISMDFPQNLFFHLISEYNSERFTKWKKTKSLPSSDLCGTLDDLCKIIQFKIGHYEVAMKIQKKTKQKTRK